VYQARLGSQERAIYKSAIPGSTQMQAYFNGESLFLSTEQEVTRVLLK